MARPRIYDDSFREALIIEAASTIAVGGIDAVALRPLATACGCTTNTIYRLFGSREGLIGAVGQYVGESFSRNQHDVQRTDDPLVDLRNLGLAYRGWALANPPLYQVMFGRLTDPGHEPTGLPTHDSIAPLIDAVTRCIEAGSLRGGTPAQITRSIWAGVHGWATLELTGAMPTDAEAGAQDYDLHLRSLTRAWSPAAQTQNDSVA